MARTHDLILLDLDGTLTDPRQGVHRSLNFALSYFGFAELSVAEVARHIGPPLDVTFAAITRSSSKALIANLVEKYRERYVDVGYAENVLYPGIAQALAELHQAGIKLGVCTSKRQDFAEKILDMFALREYLRFVDGADIGVSKSQQIARLIKQGWADSGAIMVGDRAIDIAAARQHGLAAAAVLWGYGTSDELAAAQADYSISEPAELRTLLAGANFIQV